MEKNVNSQNAINFIIENTIAQNSEKVNSEKTTHPRIAKMYFTKENLKKLAQEISKQVHKTFIRNERTDEQQEIDRGVKERLTNDIQRDIGGRLLAVREQHHLSQREMIDMFAPFTPKTISGYSRWESGENGIPLPFLVMLSEKWSEDLQWLLTGEISPLALPSKVQVLINELSKFSN